MTVTKDQKKCALEWKKWLIYGNWLTIRSMKPLKKLCEIKHSVHTHKKKKKQTK